MNNVRYDAARWGAAHDRFLTDAKNLTDEDLEQFAVVDRAFSERARAKRSGFVEAKSAEDKALDKRPATHQDLLCAIQDWIIPVLATYRYKSNETQERLYALESRLTAVESKPHVKFCGVYESGRSYAPGDACTHGGGLWICKAATMGQPNQDYVGWTLAVKSRSIP